MAVAASRSYKVALSAVSISTAITIIQIKAGATVPLQIIAATIDQSSTTTSTQLRAQLNRKSAAATVTTQTPEKLGPTTDPAASAVGGTSATGTNASAEGTDTGVIGEGAFNYLNGWVLPVNPKALYFVDAVGIIGLKFPAAPGATTFIAVILFEELG